MSSTSLPTVVVAGATGNIGTHIINALLSDTFRPKFREVIGLSRSTTSEASKSLTARGVKVVAINANDAEDLAAALKGADVLVDAAAASADGFVVSSNFVKAAAKSGVKLYIPSDFGFDHHRIAFQHPVWTAKGAIQDEAVKAGLQLAGISVALFLEDSFNPLFGFDVANSKVTGIGSPDSRFSLTSKPDIGMSVAAVIALWAESPSAVPQTLHIASDTMSYGEARKLLSKAYGREFTLEIEDLDLFKKDAVAKLSNLDGDFVTSVLPYLRLLHANGVGDHSKNDNELINPGEKYWHWMSIAEYVEASKGA